MNYAVVGFGTAGYHAVREIRRRDPAGTIDVYSNTALAPYNPMLTTYYAVGKLGYEGLFPFGPLEDIQKELSFRLHQEPVLKVHADSRSVETGKGRADYDRILISTGARAFAPPIAGLAAEDGFLMRTVEDAEKFKGRLERGDVKHAVVIGASMVGIKVAETLYKYGIDTYLLDLAPYIFPLAAYPEVAQCIQRRVEEKGVHLKFGVTIDRMEKEAGQNVAVLTDGSRIPADLVGLCIGTRANTEVVQGEVTIGRGIVVDAHMRTSAPGIYGAGDCCEGNNLETGQTQIIGLWANANHQGTAAGANMAGADVVFQGNILHNITHFMDMDFIGFGDNRLTGTVLESGNLGDGLYIRLVLDGPRIVGANLLDYYQISGIVKNYMLRLFRGERFVLPDYQRAMLIQAGLSPEFLEKIEENIHG